MLAIETVILKCGHDMIPDGIVANTASALVSGFFAMLLWDWFKQGRMQVRRITSAGSDKDKRDIDDLVGLYLEHFPDSSIDYSAEEIRSFFERDARKGTEWHIEANDIYLIAKYKGKVVGFIFCHHYPSRKKAIVSYFCIDKTVEEARKTAAKLMLKELGNLLDGKAYECDYLFFDVERPEAHISKDENLTRKARIQLFLSTARSSGKTAYVLCFNYHGPKVSMEDETHERPLVLMFIPFNGDVLKCVPKAKVLEFLEFVYFDCYGDHYATADERFEPYRQHLRESIKGYELELPDAIPVSRDRLPRELQGERNCGISDCVL